VLREVMKYSAYPAYKDSGVEWLGDIPQHWKTKRVKHCLQSIEQGWSPSCENRIAEDDEWGVLKVGCVNGAEFNPNENKALPTDLEPRPELEIKPGDVLMSRANTRELVGSTSVIKSVRPRLLLCDKLYRLKVNISVVNPDYLVLSLGSTIARFQMEQDATGASGSMQNIGQEDVQNIVLPLADLEEQFAIASFLNHETAKIDALIAKKERLIELLQEKHTAIISHAVTKGLDPTVQMKDSGVEWLGKIPTHWEKTRIKYALHQIVDTEHKTAPFYPDGEYLVVRTSNVRNGQLVLDDAKYTDHEGFREWTKRGKPEPGDILFTREAPAGETCLVPENLPLCLGQRMVLFRVNHQMLDENYGIWSLYGGIAAEFISSLSQGSTVAHFNMADIGNIPLLLPPIEEQTAIASYLDRETAKIDALIAKIREGIEKLKEYRTALISAAVTGKIDVRNEVAS
jgi:type I restriction enzyme S subunit